MAISLGQLHAGWLQRTLIRLLSRFAPHAGVLQLDASGVSREPVEVQRYLDDPLVYNGKMTARFIAELFGAMQRMQQRAVDIELPLLILHGGADSMTSPEGSRFLHNAASSSDKTLTVYPGLYHEIFNEPERDAVISDVLHWCEARLPETTG